MNKTTYTTLTGITIGIGFNIYELNIIYGVLLTLLFTGVLVWNSDYKGILIFILSIIIGTGPMLGYYYKYPQILQTRLLERHDCAVNQLSDIWKYFKLLCDYHWNPKLAAHWFPKLAIIPMMIGILATLFKKERMFWILFFMIFAGTVGVWIASGNLGKRRVASLIYFEWIYAAIGLQMVINVFQKEK